MRIVAVAAMLIAGICSNFLAGACAPRQPPARNDAQIYKAPPLQPHKLTASDRRIVEAAAARPLRDPGTAQFRDVTAGRREEGGAVVCGFINGRNAYGAYV